jgi:hypothetical protein
MRIVIVDTDIASFLFKEDTRAELCKPHIECDLLAAISFQTRAELDQWAVYYNCGPERRDELSKFVNEEFVTIASNEPLCVMGVRSAGWPKRGGRPIDVADAWVAVTALCIMRSSSLTTPRPSTFFHEFESSRSPDQLRAPRENGPADDALFDGFCKWLVDIHGKTTIPLTKYIDDLSPDCVRESDATQLIFELTSDMWINETPCQGSKNYPLA